jgi:hypothetical protein
MTQADSVYITPPTNMPVDAHDCGAFWKSCANVRLTTIPPASVITFGGRVPFKARNGRLTFPAHRRH